MFSSQEPSLRTNLVRRKKDKMLHTEVDMHSAYLPGDRVGEFRLGSTVVLVSEKCFLLRFIAIHLSTDTNGVIEWSLPLLTVDC